MKLYNLKAPGRYGTPIKIEAGGEVFEFTHLDGMFAPVRGPGGHECYLHASAELEPTELGYRIIRAPAVPSSE